MHKLEEKIRRAKEQGRLALIPFLTANFPDQDRFWEAMEELDQNGADIIEIGIPFSDPVADGPVVEAASAKVLAQGATLASILRDLGEKRKNIKAEIVLMGYLNPFLQFGYEALAEEASKAGVAGFIVPDLPLEETGKIKGCLKERGIVLIPLVGPNTSPQRMSAYARDAEGYVYVVSVLGITGERKKIADNVAKVIDRARAAFNIPIALGFGLKEPAQLDILPADSRPDAAVFGSALLSHLEKGKSAASFIKAWH